MKIQILTVIAPVVALAINKIAQITIVRAKVSLLKSVYLGFISGLVILILIHLYLPLNLGLAITNCITYVALGYCYFHFINLGETARRIRIVRELYESPGGLTLEQISERYNSKTIIEKRLNRLLSNRQIVLRENRYYVGKKTVLFMSKTLDFLKFMLLGKTHEKQNSIGDS
jgi:hypothetical protein